MAAAATVVGDRPVKISISIALEAMCDAASSTAVGKTKVQRHFEQTSPFRKNVSYPI